MGEVVGTKNPAVILCTLHLHYTAFLGSAGGPRTVCIGTQLSSVVVCACVRACVRAYVHACKFTCGCGCDDDIVLALFACLQGLTLRM